MAKMLLRTRKYSLVFKILYVCGIVLTYIVIGAASRNSNSAPVNVDYDAVQIRNGGGRRLLAVKNDANCTPAAIFEFPPDGLTREQRQHGWALIHAFAACYLFILLAIVCDDYFVPAIKKMCDTLQMKEDVAGATFMATASSSPELFINCVGTFVTQGDLGVGTIVGSAVFNVLAVPACCGLFSNMVIQLEWWPISRDSMMYGVSVLMLIGVLKDGRVEFYEAVVLVSSYVFYIGTMYFNEEITNAVHKLARLCKRRKSYKEVVFGETQPLLLNSNGIKQNNNVILHTELTLKDCEDLEESTSIWKWPNGESGGAKCWWIFTWPISFVLYLTTPDCRKYPKLQALTFIMCIFWIGTTSYIVAWLITVIGDTLNIPDSVMGLTFLAAGTSVPEAVSSIIVTNQGHGAMGLSSSIGSNTFDILLCLGLPWLIKTWFYPKIPGEHTIFINSSGLNYSAISLFSTLVLFYLSLLYNRFKLDWKVGLTCLAMYVAFLSVASLIELNVFLPVNLPTCDR